MTSGWWLRFTGETQDTAIWRTNLVLLLAVPVLSLLCFILGLRAESGDLASRAALFAAAGMGCVLVKVRLRWLAHAGCPGWLGGLSRRVILSKLMQSSDPSLFKAEGSSNQQP